MKYTAPEIEVLKFDLVDVIQTSTIDPDNPGVEGPGRGEDDLPWG